MNRRLYAAALATVALTACSRSSSPSTSGVVPGSSAPATTAATASHPVGAVSASATPAGTMRAAVYYLGGPASRPVLYREFRTVPRSTAVIRSAVEAMLHLTPLDSDYRSLWPRATTVRGVSVSGATATVDLSASARAVTAGTATERASLQQLVHTVSAAAPSITSVRLRFDGATKPTLWGHVSTTGAIARGPQADVLAAVWVIDPAPGASVGHAFTAKGSASVFEATVSWSVTRTDGSPIKNGFVNASVGGPGRGDYTVAVTLPASAHGTVVFTAWESSAKDGSVQSPDSKTYRVA
ncbi:MAG: hypothetical protein QOE45_2653 [Frankiaceae bacterium]|jgi:hypothetical protein|nr:hypothetical protein [Frankiaceae bacterium]